MAIPRGLINPSDNKALTGSNPAIAVIENQGVTPGKPNLGPRDLAAFWQLPIAPVTMLAEVLCTSPQGVGRLGSPIYRIGSGLFVKLIEVAHNFRAMVAEGSK